MACLRTLRALLIHAPYWPYVTCVLYVPNYISETGKLKILILIKSNEGSFTDIFKGAEF